MSPKNDYDEKLPVPLLMRRLRLMRTDTKSVMCIRWRKRNQCWS